MVKSGQVRSGQVRSGQVRSCQVRSGEPGPSCNGGQCKGLDKPNLSSRAPLRTLLDSVRSTACVNVNEDSVPGCGRRLTRTPPPRATILEPTEPAELTSPEPTEQRSR